MPLARLAVAVLLAVLAACGAGSDRLAVQTLEPGVVKIAITSTTVTNTLDPEAVDVPLRGAPRPRSGLRVEWQVVPFDRSWELAGKDAWTWWPRTWPASPIASAPAARSRRRSSTSSGRCGSGRPIRAQYRTIADFVGKKVGAVKGMAAERDLLRRAPPGVQIVSTPTFPELYAQFGLRPAGRGRAGRVLRARRPRDPLLRTRPRPDRSPRPQSRSARRVGLRRPRQEHGPARGGERVCSADALPASPHPLAGC